MRVRLASRVKCNHGVTRIFLFLVLLTTLLNVASFGSAQERHNHLAVDGEILDEAGPYYFIAQGDSQNAYARAVPFAEALGLAVSFDPNDRTLLFSDGVSEAEFDATSDIATGLVKRPDALRVDGENRVSPMAILVDGNSFVAITPLVDAFGGQHGWNDEVRVVTVQTVDRSAPALGAPRLGLNDGVSRVAIDLPSGQSYRALVDGNTLALIVPGVRAPAGLTSVADHPNLSAVGFDLIGGEVALLIGTRYSLSSDGDGFRLGHVERGDYDTLYVDLAPELKGEGVESGTVGVPQVADLPVPSHHVVIDAGHGGRDPGTAHYATEKEVVLAVALEVMRVLEAEGVDVTLTRDDDTFVELRDRAGFATPERNLFVSIHANAGPSSAQGIETWVFGKPLDPSLISLAIKENGGGELGLARTEEALASSITGEVFRESQLVYSESLADEVQRKLIEQTGARDRGVRQNAFLVLREARTPSILIEVGFVSHPEEGRKLATRDYQRKLGQAIASGILDFLQSGGTLAGR